MTSTDPRRPAARARFLEAMRNGIRRSHPEFCPVRLWLHAATYDLRPDNVRIGAPIVVFRRIRRQYIEEFLPMIAGMVDENRASSCSTRSGSENRAQGLRTHDDPRVGAAGGAINKPMTSAKRCTRRGNLAGRWPGDRTDRRAVQDADQPEWWPRHPRRLFRDDRAPNRARRSDSCARWGPRGTARSINAVADWATLAASPVSTVGDCGRAACTSPAPPRPTTFFVRRPR